MVWIYFSILLFDQISIKYNGPVIIHNDIHVVYFILTEFIFVVLTKTIKVYIMSKYKLKILVVLNQD